MRTCAKMRCANDPTATVALVYADRAVVIVGLLAERDPNLLDLCDEQGRNAIEIAEDAGHSILAKYLRNGPGRR